MALVVGPLLGRIASLMKKLEDLIELVSVYFEDFSSNFIFNLN